MHSVTYIDSELNLISLSANFDSESIKVIKEHINLNECIKKGSNELDLSREQKSELLLNAKNV